MQSDLCLRRMILHNVNRVHYVQQSNQAGKGKEEVFERLCSKIHQTIIEMNTSEKKRGALDFTRLQYPYCSSANK